MPLQAGDALGRSLGVAPAPVKNRVLTGVPGYRLVGAENVSA